MALQTKWAIRAVSTLAIGFGIHFAAAQDAVETPRKLVAGVITTIRDTNIDDATVDETREFTELISVARPPEWTPNFDPTTDTLLEMARRVGFQRDVWSLEFGFKPLRVINVDGKNVWYLVYFVRNVRDDGSVRSARTANQSISISGEQKPIRFIPSLVLQSFDVGERYRDQNRPEIVKLIAAKERVTRGKLHDSASISQIEIPVSTPTADNRVWAVATWDNVDPRTDFASVFVYGLTNAYRWEPPKNGYEPGKPQTEQDVIQSKALQLNFWRGGDNVNLHDNEVNFGVPLYPDEPLRQNRILKAYGIDKPVTHRWVYR